MTILCLLMIALFWAVMCESAVIETECTIERIDAVFDALEREWDIVLADLRAQIASVEVSK